MTTLEILLEMTKEKGISNRKEATAVGFCSSLVCSISSFGMEHTNEKFPWPGSSVSSNFLFARQCCLDFIKFDDFPIITVVSMDMKIGEFSKEETLTCKFLHKN